MKLVRIEPGRFRMGESATVSDDLLIPVTYPTRQELQKRFPRGDPAEFHIPFEAARHGDFDEKPVHDVTITRRFYMGSFEVTNRQYELFDASHRALRGKRGFSKNDDEAVIFVSWEDAKAFCDWLSKKEGLLYRLPTEAEWEYAARAGTTSLYYTGDRLPPAFLKNARSTDFRDAADVVPLTVGQTPPNPWALFDMHGNVEEWTADWYGPYESRPQRDPAGRAGGDFKVTRGGSHGTDPYYLRSANRMGSLPETRSWTIGFRVVLGPAPATRPLPREAPRRYQVGVRQPAGFRAPAVDPSRPYFRGPRRYVIIPPNSHGPVYSHHNHDTAIAECPNGDLLAIWYTCEQERGRELAVAASRLRYGAEEWEPASPFWDAPDRNDHCPALWFDGKQTLYHFNGLGVAGRWEPLAIVMRTSQDNGVTWSKARLIAPEFGFRNMVGQPVLRTREGEILFGADASGGSTIWISRDGGESWSDPGGNIAGIHAGIVELLDGRLMALGRGQNIAGWMPMSVSADKGVTWKSSASVFPPLGGGQRGTLLRLREGPLFFAAFAENVNDLRPAQGPGDRRGRTSLFGALSFDEGKTWPVRRVIAPDSPEHGAPTIDGGWIRMSPAVSEPQGYLASCQGRDGVIQLISSFNHYSFNAAWLRQGQPDVSKAPSPKMLQARGNLASSSGGAKLDAADARKGLTVEVIADGDFAMDLFVRGGTLTSNRYTVRYSGSGRHVYRIAVRDDTAAQVYRDGLLTATEPAEVIIDWRQPARGSYLELKAPEGGTVSAIAIDLSGAYAPGAVKGRP